MIIIIIIILKLQKYHSKYIINYEINTECVELYNLRQQRKLKCLCIKTLLTLHCKQRHFKGFLLPKAVSMPESPVLLLLSTLNKLITHSYPHTGATASDSGQHILYCGQLNKHLQLYTNC